MGVTYYVVLLFSLSVHESAHGFMAWRMGDDTALRQGRVSLNPFVHIDPVGTLLIPLLQIFGPSGIPLLGWAKPTPVGAQNFRRLAQGHVLVAGAGPVSNLILAVIFTVLLLVTVRTGLVQGQDALPALILAVGIQMNVALAIFNLVPLPPLDGSWVASWGLPRSIAARYDRVVEPYGMWILLILFMTGLLGRVVQPLVSLLTDFLFRLAL
ncbi:MAG TPA: site-2 protease family protein [Vicinamibacteria bacterium]|jgi:Zn-dependent protease|nr:site-2 protease family protein [Vicinamibacteria bacterium]